MRCVNPVDVPDNISDPSAWLKLMFPEFEGFRPADPSIRSGATALADADLLDPTQFANPVEDAPSEPDENLLL